ncbi:MAG: hypothetical protein M3164_02025 [Actinomycetota bacterium]|nr:hypothetical protein [Actinomycetota bacterium]
MNETAVGMKCPACARPGGAARMEARRWRAGVAGLASSAAIGALLSVVRIGRLGFLIALLAGVVCGSVVRAAGKRRPGLGGTAALATACGLALGALAVGVPVPALFSSGFVVTVVAATVAAAFTAGR